MLRNAELSFDDGVGMQRGVDGREQSGNALAGNCGNGHSRDGGALGAFNLRARVRARN